MQNEKRTLIQDSAVALMKAHDHLLLTWATGCGKSLAALRCVKEAGGRWIIVCKEINHIDNWRREIGKHDIQDTKFGQYIVDIICYASLHKYEGIEDINLILDECHALSELRETKIENMGVRKIISLSATVDGEVKARLGAIKPFYEFHISTSDAIKEGILPEPKVYIIEVELDTVKKIYSAKFGKKEVKMTAAAYYKHLSSKVGYWQNKADFSTDKWTYNRLMSVALERKRWLVEYKTPKAEEIVANLWGRRFICFTGSIDQCDKLGGERVLHSKISPKKRASLIDDLNNKVIDNLFCVNMMKESMNIESIEAGMIVQLDGANDRSFIQTLGRTLRGERPEFFILYVKGTQDEKYLKTALNNFDKKYLIYADKS